MRMSSFCTHIYFASHMPENRKFDMAIRHWSVNLECHGTLNVDILFFGCFSVCFGGVFCVCVFAGVFVCVFAGVLVCVFVCIFVCVCFIVGVGLVYWVLGIGWGRKTQCIGIGWGPPNALGGP